MRKMLTAMIAGIALIALTGCGQTDGQPTNDAGTGNNRPGISEPTSAEASTNSKFGAAFTFKNNLAVSVSPPEPYTPSSSASGGDSANQFVVFTVTVVNGSTDNYDPVLFTADLQSGNREAEKVYDSANDIGAPTTVVLPGRESEFRLAFAVIDPEDLVLQVSPGFKYRDAIFTS